MKFELTLFLVILLMSCKVQENEQHQYLRWVGDTAFNPDTDKPTYKLCDPLNVGQYHNFSMGLQYEGEKSAIKDVFHSKYRPVEVVNESGLIRIRFVVNCQGETDRFRVLGMNEKYESFEFDEQIVAQLLHITKSLKGWKILPDKTNPRDYYQYLIFKIQNGQIIDIMP